MLLATVFTPSLASAQTQPLKVVYPPKEHKTSSDKIFFIGSAPSTGQVLINGQPINRSRNGYFAPSLPLKLGDNLFSISYQNQEIKIRVTRTSTKPLVSQGEDIIKTSLTPAVDIARLEGELICFRAVASSNGKVSVKVGEQTIPLLLQSQQTQLPSNLAALTGTNQPQVQTNSSEYKGCTTFKASADVGKPVYQLNLNGKTITQTAPGNINILSPVNLQTVKVTVDAGVSRTGPSTNYSRLTPLPKGTSASVTGKEGEWLRLDYGAWIKSEETQILTNATPPRSIIRSVTSKKLDRATEIIFPLQVPVPVSIYQSDRTLELILHNTTAQTDIIRLDDNPFISRLDWQQVSPDKVKYIFNFKTNQQWGYNLKYQGTSLVLILRHPPKLKSKKRKPLSGIKILIDPGHGGKESGAVGPDGTPEKDVNLAVCKLLRQELIKRGANVVMTRVDDKFVSLGDRQSMIAKEEPAIALSVHYNALPDYGDAENTQGVGMFWYNTQAHSLAVFLHNYLVKKLKRPSYGVFWNNLALTRPAEAPSILLELGFMSNPTEFEWVSNPKEQKKLATTLADGVVEWLRKSQQKF
ncbi:MAG: N-acetylmuramoyl-L-alanine amidase [Cyanobacteria bacterium P01_A01_bin.45]